MSERLPGRARVVGDDINSEYIIASTRKRDTLDASLLRHFLLEAVDSSFAASVRPGDLLVAGRHFGCGSEMEVAVTVILGAGIPAVLARSFARSFYRNAINNGLVPIECDTTRIREGDRLIIHQNGSLRDVENLTRGDLLRAAPLPALALDILEAGGLVAYVRKSNAGPMGSPGRRAAGS